jgi:hypothetical protein
MVYKYWLAPKNTNINLEIWNLMYEK